MGTQVDTSSTEQVRVRARKVSKTFGPARVLCDVSIEVRAGEIHALLGANGSGKSTFVKCLTGVHMPDPGSEIELGGKLVPKHYTTSVAAEHGVRVVHQEAPLIEELTLAETVGHYYGFPTRAGLIQMGKLRRETSELLERLDVPISPDTLAGDLSAPERAMVTLALALGDPEEHGNRLIVLDEPTAAMTANDSERFLSAVEAAAGHGAGVLMVTHRLAEVFGICDDITILRGGQVVFASPTAETNSDQVIDEIIGPAKTGNRRDETERAPERFFRAEAPGPAKAGDPPLVRVQGLAGGILEEATFELYPGEILGISGILGSGAEQMARLMTGAEAPSEGEVWVMDQRVELGNGPGAAIRAGVTYVPGDRLREGGIESLPVVDNMILPNLPYYGAGKKRQREDFETVVSALDVRPPEAERIFGTLSGGNQQKVIVGKWALMRPEVFVLDNPTAGVDPGAREDILTVLSGLASAGTGVLVVSSEPEQLARIATRVLVMRSGRIAEELTGEEVNERTIAGASW